MTVEQHTEARLRANQTRLLRGKFRADVSVLDTAAGRTLLADMIADGVDRRDDVRQALTNARAVDCIHWVRKMPADSADRYVEAVGASLVRTVGELTDRQRGCLAELLRGGIDAVRQAEEDNALALWKREHHGDVAA